MKRFVKFSIAVASAILAVACNVQEPEAPVVPETPAAEENVIVFTANFEATKAQIGTDGKFTWEAGDKIEVYDGSWHEVVTLTADDITDGGASATIKVTGLNAEAPEYYAVYPADLPTYLSEDHNIGLSCMFNSKSKSRYNVSKCSNAEKSFSFHSASCLICFETEIDFVYASIDVPYGGYKDPDPILAGDYCVNPSNGEFVSSGYTTSSAGYDREDGEVGPYYFDVFPGLELDKGFSITLYDGDIFDGDRKAIATFTYDKPLTTVRGKVYNIKNFDERLDGGDVPATESINITSNSVFVPNLGNGSYGSYKDILTECTIDGFAFEAQDICRNQNNTPSGLATNNFVQIKKTTGVLTSKEELPLALIKIYTYPGSSFNVSFASSDDDFSAVSASSTNTETVSIATYADKQVGAPIDVELDVNTFTAPEGSIYFKIAATTATYIYKIEISYSSGEIVQKYNVVCDDVTGGTISASPARAEADDIVTLSATPDEEYTFNNDWTVVDADENLVTVTDGQFTMPACNVSVSCSFTKKTYSITKNAAEHGTYTVTNEDGDSVTSASKGDKITLTASPAEGYILDRWEVLNTSEETVTVTGNTFYMPASAVSVSAYFVAEAAVSEYASLEELVAAELTSGTIVKVSFENVPIKSVYVTSKGYRNGIYFDIQKGGKDIEIFYRDVPNTWVVGGTVSGTMTCPWTNYNDTWELAPEQDSWDWTNLTYTAPLAPCADPVITISETGSATIECATDGASIYYTVGTTPADPTKSSTLYSGAVAMTDGQTIKAIAYKDGMAASAVMSAKFSAAGADPFEWNGGDKNSLTGMDGVTANGLGSDYAESHAPYRVKLDGTDDNVIIEVDFEIESVQLGVKMIGGSTTSYINVQESTSKSGPFTDVQTMTISGKQNDVVNFTTSNAFKSGSRAVKLNFTKGSNVGLGYIKITPKN